MKLNYTLIQKQALVSTRPQVYETYCAISHARQCWFWPPCGPIIGMPSPVGRLWDLIHMHRHEHC